VKKRILIFILALALATCLTAAASSVNVKTSIEETIGTIIVNDCGCLHISGEALTHNALGEVIITVGDAPIYSLLSGLPIPLNSIKPGMEARIAYIDKPEGLPQAIAIWLHPNHADAAVFTTTVSDNIQYGPGYCVFLSADGKYRITLDDDTLILDSNNKQITPEDIGPGQSFFIWVDMVTASSPALVYPDKVVNICQLQ